MSRNLSQVHLDPLHRLAVALEKLEAAESKSKKAKAGATER